MGNLKVGNYEGAARLLELGGYTGFGSVRTTLFAKGPGHILVTASRVVIFYMAGRHTLRIQ